ncbi:MAG: TonB-dependent receptor [Terracidiphilus sp.]
MLGLLLVTLCLAGVAAAQGTNSGDMRGIVTDPTGAVVPDVKVTVLNVDTGVSLAFTTNDAGLYDTVSILPGNYSVTFSKAGFEDITVRGIVLQAGNPQTVNGKLTVGSTAVTVSVSAETPLLQTETGDQSTTIDTHTIQELPSFGRDWTQLTKTLPGAVGSGSGVSMNGIEPWEANQMNDGGTAINPHSANNDPVMFETVSEIQVESSNYTAQYGTGSLVINSITKSGTNQFHGSAYEFVENNAFDSLGYNNTSVPKLRYDNYGVALGGPTFANKLFKNKAFFFFNWDKIHNTGAAGTNEESVPTSDMEAGNFVNYIAAWNAKYPTNPITGIYDPSVPPTAYGPGSTLPCNGKVVQPGQTGYCRTTLFSYNGVNNVIPPGRMDPVALAVQKYYPAPNVSGVYTNNYLEQNLNTSPWANYFGRADIQFTDSNRLTMSFTLKDNPNPNTGNLKDGNVDSYNGDVTSWTDQITDVWTLSPNLINEARMSFQREDDHYLQDNVGQNYPQKVGWTYSQANMFPCVQLGGAWYTTNIGCTNTTAIYAENTVSPGDSLTWIHGKHVLHFGGEVFKFMDNDTPWGFLNGGQLGFYGAYTANAPANALASVGYADFLLGDSASFYSQVKPIGANRETEPQFYVQDDFKLRPNITLNIGLRYQIMSGWHENHNQFGEFDPSINNPAFGQATYVGNNPSGAMWFANNDGRQDLQATIHDILLPRVGFAWSTNHKFVVRGGAGMFIQPWSEDTYAANAEGTGFSTTCNLSDTSGGLTPAVQFDAANPNLNCIAASRSPSAYNYTVASGGGGVGYYPYNTPVTTVYQYSLSVERELMRGMVAQVAYVGNKDTGMPFGTVDFNQVPESEILQSFNSSAAAQQLLRPYPQFGSISAYGGNYNAIGNYNALQGSLRKRFGNGLLFDTNYTWSRMLNEGDTAGWGGSSAIAQNSYDPKASYGLSNQSRKALFKADAVYDLPFGKGRTFLNQGGPVDYILGGWQASGILDFRSGQPFNVYMGGPNNSGSLANNWFPNLTGNPNASSHTLAQWFNPAAYSTPTSGTFGDDGRNTLIGPRYFDLDFSAAKSFPIPKLENGAFQLRMDATNFTNHTSYGTPNNYIGGGTPGLINSAANQQRLIELGGRLSF